MLPVMFSFSSRYSSLYWKVYIHPCYLCLRVRNGGMCEKLAYFSIARNKKEGHLKMSNECFQVPLTHIRGLHDHRNGMQYCLRMIASKSRSAVAHQAQTRSGFCFSFLQSSISYNFLAHDVTMGCSAIMFVTTISWCLSKIYSNCRLQVFALD